MMDLRFSPGFVREEFGVTLIKPTSFADVKSD